MNSQMMKSIAVVTSVMITGAIAHKNKDKGILLPAIIEAPVIAQAKHYTVARATYGKVVERTEPTYFCKKPGYVLIGHTCNTNITTTSQLVCPVGYFNDGGICVQHSSAIGKCPGGFYRKGDECEKVIETDILHVCPEGTQTLGGVCEKDIPHSLVPVCDKGTLNHLTGTCWYHNFVAATPYCADGFTFLDGSCVQEESYDCTDAVHTFVSAAFHHGYKRQLTECKPGIFGYVQENGECFPMPPPVAPTHTKVTVQKTCTRVSTTGLRYQCDEGVIQNTQCCITEHITATPTCPVLGGVDNCHIRQRVAPLSECPAGYLKRCSFHGCRCIAVETVALAYQCPLGFSQLNEHHICLQTVPIDTVCPLGYKLEGDICIKAIAEVADCIFQVTYECDHTIDNSCEVHNYHKLGLY